MPWCPWTVMTEPVVTKRKDSLPPRKRFRVSSKLRVNLVSHAQTVTHVFVKRRVFLNAAGDYYYADIPRSEFGFRPYPKHPGRPFKVYAGFHMTRQARLWTSKTLDAVIAEGAQRAVEIPAERNVSFNTIFEMVIEIGAEVYVCGAGH